LEAGLPMTWTGRPAIRLEIRTLYESMKTDSISDVEWKGKQILDLIYDLNTCGFIEDPGALAHTLNKEIEYAKYSEKETRYKNAAKKRTTEYKADVSKAISQIHSEISLIWLNPPAGEV
jgi:hypothetical protein